jgi:hypothetical protein
MERRGFKINWIDATLPMEEKVETILEKVNSQIVNSQIVNKYDGTLGSDLLS